VDSTVSGALPSASEEMIALGNPTPVGRVMDILSAIWLAGVLLMLAYALVSDILLRYRLRDAVTKGTESYKAI